MGDQTDAHNGLLLNPVSVSVIAVPIITGDDLTF
jgi:hypothetical protein